MPKGWASFLTRSSIIGCDTRTTSALSASMRWAIAQQSERSFATPNMATRLMAHSFLCLRFRNITESLHVTVRTVENEVNCRIWQKLSVGSYPTHLLCRRLFMDSKNDHVFL